MLSDGFLPHGYRYLWTPGLVELHVISDALMAISYLTIPVTLVYFIRKRRDIETVRTLGLYWLLVNQAPPLRTLHTRAPRSE